MSEKRTGRPAKREEDRQSERVVAKVTKAEAEAVRRRVEGLSTAAARATESSYLRSLILRDLEESGEMPPAEATRASS